MINLKFYLDKRHLKGDDTRPASVKIVVTRRRTTALISTGISVLPTQWNYEKLVVTNHPNEKKLNLHLSKMFISIQNIVLDMEENGLASGMNAKEVKDYITNKLNPKEAETEYFVDWLNKFTQLKERERTIALYNATLLKIKQFSKRWETLTFEEMDNDWFISFEDFLKKQSNSINSRGIHLRNIRAVFNYAISENATMFYPFKKFKIKKEPTLKRSLSAKQLRTLLNCSPSRYASEGKDIFALTFFLCGINFIDLINLKKENVINGRIEYIRSKTKRHYSILLLPEAEAIIEKYKGEEYLINIRERIKLHHNAISAVNDKIKELAKECNIPNWKNISSYWARHSWATTAAELDIPKETIAAGLGHSIGNPITSIYIDFNLKKVDEANRKIIDYVLYNKV